MAQFTSTEYQQFLKDHHIVSSMSDVGHCGDNAPAEGFSGKLKRERVHRRRYLTLVDARADVFDYIERFHNPIIQRRLDVRDHAFRLLNRPWKRGRTRPSLVAQSISSPRSIS